MQICMIFLEHLFRIFLAVHMYVPEQLCIYLGQKTLRKYIYIKVSLYDAQKINVFLKYFRTQSLTLFQWHQF